MKATFWEIYRSTEIHTNNLFNLPLFNAYKCCNNYNEVCRSQYDWP